MKYTVIVCKWSVLRGFYTLYNKIFRSREKALKYQPKRGFIWGYVIDGKEIEHL